MPLHVVVMAGGSGERLWPRSRAARPKPLLPVAEGGATLLATTRRRAARLAPAARTWLVCTAGNAPALRAAAGLPARQVLIEPQPRNTAMAIGYAATRIAAADPDAVLAVLPADHSIPDARAFANAIRRAARAAETADVLVTLGVKPTRPETGYGYIAVGPAIGATHPGLHRVRGFHEKPNAPRARRFVRAGHLWNAGIFVGRAARFLDEIAAHEPALARVLAPLRGRLRPPRAAIARAYRAAPALAIDVAVFERSARVWTLPIAFAWSDLGSWAAVAAERGVDGRRSAVVAGEAWLEDAPGNLVWGSDRPIALLGVEGLAVVDTGDALLVTRLDRSDEVRRVVARARGAGRRDLL